MPKLLTLENVNEIKDYVDSKTVKHYIHNIRMRFSDAINSSVPNPTIRGVVSFSYINTDPEPRVVLGGPVIYLTEILQSASDSIPASGLIVDKTTSLADSYVVDSIKVDRSVGVNSVLAVVGTKVDDSDTVFTAYAPVNWFSYTDTVYAID